MFCFLFYSLYCAVLACAVYCDDLTNLFFTAVQGRDPQTYRHNDEGLIMTIELPFSNEILNKCSSECFANHYCWSLQLYNYKDHNYPNGIWRCLLYNHQHDLKDFDNDGLTQNGFQIIDIHAYNRLRSCRYDPNKRDIDIPRPSWREITPGTPKEEIGTPPKIKTSQSFAFPGISDFSSGYSGPEGLVPVYSISEVESYVSECDSALSVNSNQYSGSSHKSNESNARRLSGHFRGNDQRSSNKYTVTLPRSRLSKDSREPNNQRHSLSSRISTSEYNLYVASLTSKPLSNIPRSIPESKETNPGITGGANDPLASVELTGVMRSGEPQSATEIPNKSRSKKRRFLPWRMFTTLPHSSESESSKINLSLQHENSKSTIDHTEYLETQPMEPLPLHSSFNYPLQRKTKRLGSLPELNCGNKPE